jgi:GNAT superfamily N-acetyltransferase
VATFRETRVDDPIAHELLTEYFSSRELSFTGGSYLVVFPDPALFESPRGCFLVVELDGVPVGCGGIRRIEYAGAGPRFEVKHVWLQEHTRGLGLGHALMAELEQHARDLGAAELVLDTNNSLIAAGAMYASRGYESIEPYNDNPNATNWYRRTLS